MNRTVPHIYRGCYALFLGGCMIGAQPLKNLVIIKILDLFTDL